MNKWLIGFIYLIVFIVCISLIVVGQRNVGPTGLLTMLVGLLGILGLMYLYNKKYQ